ncbi:P-loop containing nucleoside triphosphate hydrolase protein [Pseudoneurospora amorphoporcata]|uniref:P-loop containing nucleoside triphosphate hydrolase protein n=1 Tax=Pseudoneurospora amorphoporcata TaxID=241081 RepID=A0AAN6SFB5_9PEZI|nr:P-loop containing nucleoside triphosphate hydrolase protein [Pseudoneurospora amorphoporcata]
MPARTLLDGEANAESSRKRQRAAPTSDDSEGETATRSNANHAKRARVATARQATPADDDDADVDDERGHAGSPDSPPKTQYELMRDNNFEHLQHQDADDQRATQRLRFKPNRLGDNAVADNGILQSITCINFMCHTRLHCELGPLLNFIVGENGSGKSAILTAITLCLGGKASSTNRGGSLKTFVKEGTEKSVLIVKIKNQGQDAYRHDVYGDSISVERHFSKSGSSSFKVKTATGQIVSTRKQEVEEIVEYYALQVDNPLNVLSQDNARQFLNSSTKQQKYKFFIEGVQLQQLDNDYRLLAENLESIDAKIPDQEERVKAAAEELKRAKSFKDALDGNRRLKVKQAQLRKQMCWLQVVQEEVKLTQLDEKIAELADKIAEADRQKSVKGAALERVEDKIEDLKKELQEAIQRKTEFEEQVDERKKKAQTIRDELQQIQADERAAHQSLRSAATTVKDFEQKVAAEERRLEEATGEAILSRNRELEKAKQRVTEVEVKISNAKDDERNLLNKVDEAKKARDAKAAECGSKRDEITVAEQQLRTSKKDQGSVYAGYEPRVPELLKMIEKETRFQNKPVGPLGTYIQLLKPEWSSILEKTFGNILNAFIVQSMAEQKLLQGLMNRLHIRGCPVLIGNRHPLNTDGKEPDPCFDTILRVLKIDSMMVRDQLIINQMIEQVILIPERTKAEDVMFSGARPRNVKACLSFHDRKRDEGLRLVVNSSGGFSTSPVQPQRNRLPRMKADVGSRVAYQKETLRHLEQEYSVLDREHRRLQQEVQKFTSDLTKIQRDKKTLDSELRHAMVQVEQVQYELDQYEGGDSRLTGLKAELTDAKEKEEACGLQYGNLRLRKDERNRASSEAQAQLTEIKREFEKYEEEVNRLQGKKTRLQDLQKINLTEVNEAHVEFDMFTKDKERAEKEREKGAKAVATFIKQVVEALGSEERAHVNPTDKYEELEKQYQKIQEQLDKERRKRGMSDEEVLANLTRAKETYDGAKKSLEGLKTVTSRLRRTLTIRLEKWRKFQRYISSQSRANFIYLLSERGFRGKLLLDHERKALDLVVEPDKTEKRAAGRNTKTLSGGEKSFSSICLLLSIWEAMGSPLRCLDEFDVFMDNVNRAISTNMLITAARRSVNRQYIFITPNAIEGRNTFDKDVKIIRLTDPRQRTLADH